MKTYCFFSRLACGLLFFLGVHSAQAQAVASTDLPGYWNTEINRKTHDYTIVRFYNGQDQLVYEERLPRLCLNLTKGSRRCRQRICRQLTEALQLALHDPAHAARATAWLTQQLSQDPHETRLYAVR